MQLNISTSYGKKLKYKIYGVDGKKRRLLRKGVFLRNASEQIDADEKQLIVRIKARRNFFKYILAVLRLFAKNYLLAWNAAGAPYSRLELNNFDEILVKEVDLNSEVDIRYNLSPLIDKTYEDPASTRVRVDYLTCGTHPFVKETAKNDFRTSVYMFSLLMLLIGFVVVTSCLVLFL